MDMVLTFGHIACLLVALTFDQGATISFDTGSLWGDVNATAKLTLAKMAIVNASIKVLVNAPKLQTVDLNGTAIVNGSMDLSGVLTASGTAAENSTAGTLNVSRIILKDASNSISLTYNLPWKAGNFSMPNKMPYAVNTSDAIVVLQIANWKFCQTPPCNSSFLDVGLTVTGDSSQVPVTSNASNSFAVDIGQGSKLNLLKTFVTGNGSTISLPNDYPKYVNNTYKLRFPPTDSITYTFFVTVGDGKIAGSGVKISACAISLFIEAVVLLMWF